MLRAFLIALMVALFPGGVGAQTKGIWLTREEIAALPTTGKAWDAVKAAADKTPGTPDLSDQDELENIRTFARALVFVRTSNVIYRDKVVATLVQVQGTENGARTLAVGRKAGAYIVAADLIAYRDAAFVSWVRALRTKTLTGDDSTLVKKHETKMNNYGQACGFSRVIADVYVDDATDLARAAKVFRYQLGDRNTGFIAPLDAYGDFLGWQPDTSRPVVVLPKGATKTISGTPRSLDGALPEELRRCCSIKYPFPCENYCYSSLEHLVGTAWVLSRIDGYEDIWQTQNEAVLRVFTWLHKEANCPATGNDTHLPWIANAIYGSTFPVVSPSQPGKDFGFGDWWARPVAPVPPADFQATFQFNLDATTTMWTCHRIQNTENATGTGVTPHAAMENWLAKNPADPH